MSDWMWVGVLFVLWFVTGAAVTLTWVIVTGRYKQKYPYRYVCPEDECEFVLTATDMVGLDSIATRHEQAHREGRALGPEGLGFS